MTYINANYSIVVITDSSDRGLEMEFNLTMNTPMNIGVKSGGKFDTCIPVIDDIMTNFYIDLVYIEIGITDLTYYDMLGKH